MPKTLGGIFGFVVSALIIVLVGTFIINRVAILRAIVSNGSAQKVA